ncbi:MAG: hypothetical protein K2I42_05215, partial [Anaeroplasmataceae bacterium]|nr:hypothetical protein [Anaeroplasmataceae bacterium]
MKKKTLTYSTNQRGEISLNLNEKRMNFTHLDFEGGSGAIPFSISHIYQNNGIDKGYGTGFLLNLEQTLSKIDGTSKYKLSLPDGSEEIFEEIFYYKDEDDKRVYKTTSGQTLKRSDIEVFEDGTLKYNEHLIYIEVKSDSGMTLKSDYKDFVNSDKIDLRHEDLIQLEEEIEQLENKIQEATEDLNLQMEEAYIFDTPEYKQVETLKDDYHKQSKDLVEKQMASYNITKKEKLHNTKEQYYSKTKRENRDIGGLSNLSHDSYIASYISYDENLKRFVFKDADGKNAEKFALMDKYKDEEKFNQISDYAKLAEYYSQSFSDKVNLLNQNIQEISLEIEKEEINYQKSIIASQNALLSKEEQYLQKQNAFENLQKNRTIQQYQLIKKRTDLLIEKYALLKQQKQYQLELLYKQVPELYLINEEGLVFGFNKYGMLCAIFDAYEHQVIIEYNDDHQIKHIIDSENHKIEFIYNGKKKLIRILNEIDAYIDFSYTDSYLTKFIYSNGESYTLKYLNNTLIEIQDIDEVGFQIDYQHNLISKLKTISFPSLTIQEELSFLYDENHITVTNNQNLLSTHYLFDVNNSLTTEYCLKEDEIEGITTYDYELNHCNFVISSNKNHSKILNVEPTLIEEDLLSFNVTPLNSYTSDYILYALASADSVEGIRQRRVTAYCEHFYNHQETECRFEIRCNLYYENHLKEYSVSFNPKIKGQQLVAIPITLDKDENGQVLIPNKMNVYFDYRENNGQCKLYHLIMAQGEYIYSENNETHHKVYECFSEVTSVKNTLLEKEGYFVQKKEVSYFYNLKDLLEKQLTKITYDEYDSAAMLVRKEVKEVETHFLYNKQNKILKESDSLGNVIEYTYNSQGDCIHKKSYYKSMPNLAYMEEADIDEDGIVISNANELGYKTTYQQLNHTLVSITSPNGNVLYLHNSDSATSISLNEDGLENYNTCIYEKGKLIEYNTEGMQYQYTYEFGKEKELYINHQLYCTFVEKKSTSKIYNRTLFCDQTGYEKISDFYGKVLKINKIKGENVLPYIEYMYDSKERVVKEINYVNHKEFVLEYIYLDDTLVGIKTNEYIKTMSKDLYGNPKDTIYQMGENIY